MPDDRRAARAHPRSGRQDPRPARRAGSANARRCSGRPSPVPDSRPPGVEPWLPFGDFARVQRRAATPRSRLDALADSRPHRPAQRDPRAPRRRVPHAARHRHVLGVAARRPHAGRDATLGDDARRPCRTSTATIRISTIRARDGEHVDGHAARSSPGRPPSSASTPGRPGVDSRYPGSAQLRGLRTRRGGRRPASVLTTWSVFTPHSAARSVP